MRFWTLVVALLLASANAAMADCDHPATLAIAAGATSAVITSDENVPSVECYQVAAQAGQKLGAFVEALDGAASPVIEVYAPGWTAACDASSQCHIDGTLLSEAGDSDWSDALTDAGAYLIVVDNPSGNEYRLTVENLPPGDNQP